MLFSKAMKTVLALLCTGTMVIGLPAVTTAKTAGPETENDTIAAAARDGLSPNFFTTWMMQYTSDNAPSAFDRLNDENLFGEEGWARTLYPEARSEMYFVLDWGWDLPDSRTYSGDQQDFIGTDILDPGKFPYEGNAAQRLTVLNQKIKDLGWKGTGLWIYSQEPEGQRSSTDGKPWNEAFWRARLEESKEAGIALWKIDFGEYFHNSEWHRFITRLAHEIYPELLLERSIGGSNGALNGGVGGRERTGFADEVAYMLSYSDLYKTYDVSDHLHTAVSLERLGQILLAAYMEKGSAGGWIDSHDMPYASASLGTTIEALRANRYEVARLVAWQRDYAPAFAAGEYDTQLSGEYFADDWTFLRADEDWTGNPLGNTVQRAPSAIARGIALPTASVDGGDRPFLTASRNPSGAISIASHPRTHGRTMDQAVYADVFFPIGNLTGPVGVFGCYRSLTMTFNTSIEGKRIYARDLLSDDLTDVTQRVTVDGCSLTVPGELIETIGVSGADEGDAGAPGMFLQIGEGEGYLPAPAVNERCEVWDIPNNSFEVFDIDVNGADYDPLAAKPRPVNYIISDLSAFRLAEGGHSGRYAASHMADKACSVTTSSRKYVLPKGFYTASVWVKTSGFSAGDAARLVALDGTAELASVDILEFAGGQDLTEWTKITLPAFFVRCALTLEIASCGSAGSVLLFDDLVLSPISLEEEDALVSNIKVDGRSIQEYRSDCGKYTVPVLLSQKELPVVTVEHREDAEVTIKQTACVPGEATVTARCGTEEKTYTVRFEITDSVFISDLDFNRATSGWGTPMRDLSVESEAIRLQLQDGQTHTFEKGIGVNADSEIKLKIEDRGYSLFEAYVGIQTGKPAVASVEFLVLLDGRIAYRSGRMTSTTPAKRISLNVEGAKEMTLLVNSLDTIDWDVANWADARFSVKGAIPIEHLSPIRSDETQTVYDLSGFAATAFRADLSVAAAAGDSSATFRLVADGTTVLEKTLTAADGIQNVDVNIKDVSTLTLLTSGEGSAAAAWADATVVLDAIGYNNVITGIYANGTALDGYAFYRADYNMLLDTAAAPILTVDHLPEAEVTVSQAASVPGTATVQVTYGKQTWDFAVRFLHNSSEIYLSDLQWSSAEASYGVVHRDESTEGKPITLTVDGTPRTFSKGVGFNAAAQLDVNVSGMGFKTFTAYVGVEAEAGSRGTINFKVYVDGYCAYESGVMDGTDDAQFVAVSIEGASAISLIADCVDDIIWDHGAWADAKFSKEQYQFGAWSSEDRWLVSNQAGFAAVACGEELQPLTYGELLKGGIRFSCNVEFYSSGDVPDEAGFQFYNASSGIRIGGRIKGVHDEAAIDLIYCLPGGAWTTVYESARWISSGKTVHVQITSDPSEEILVVTVSNATGILISRAVSFPGVTEENFYACGDGLQFSFHNDNPSRYKVSDITFASEETAPLLTAKPGDVNYDGEVDIFDIHAIRNHVSGEKPLSGNNLKPADANCDGEIDAGDLAAVCDHIFGVGTLPETVPLFLNKTSIALQVGQQYTLIAYNASDTVSWHTDNSAVATVDNGVVTAIGAGTAIITADDGTASASCVVTVEEVPVTISQFWTMPTGWTDASEGSALAFSGEGSLAPNTYKTTFRGDHDIHVAFDVTPNPEDTTSSFYLVMKAPSQSEYLRIEFQWGVQSPSHVCNANVVLNRGAAYGYAWQLLGSTNWTWTGLTYHVEIAWDATAKKLTLSKTGDPAVTQTATVLCDVPSAAGTAGENFFDCCGDEELQLEINTWEGGFTLSDFVLESGFAAPERITAKGGPAAEPVPGASLSVSETTLMHGETTVAAVDLEHYGLFSSANGITDLQVEVTWDTRVLEFIPGSAACLTEAESAETYQKADYNPVRGKMIFLFYAADDIPLKADTASLCTFALRVRDNAVQAATVDFSVTLKYVDLQGRPTTASVSSLPAVNVQADPAYCQHSFEADAELSKAPTCIDAGCCVYVCTKCGSSYSEPIEPLGHLFVEGVCSRCGAVDPDYVPPAHTDPCEGYDDIERDSWYHAAADFVIEHGYMGSTSQTALHFEPLTNVSRAMVASILYRICGVPADVEYKGTFSDVPDGQWYSKAVEWCAQKGLASGKGDGRFDPNGLVTRQELAVFMSKLDTYLTADDPDIDSIEPADLSSFPDADSVPAWAESYLKWAVAAGLISGKGQPDGTTLLAPTATAMRCELASILQRFLRPPMK